MTISISRSSASHLLLMFDVLCCKDVSPICLSPAQQTVPVTQAPGRLQMRHPVMMDSCSSASEAPACTT